MYHTTVFCEKGHVVANDPEKGVHALKDMRCPICKSTKLSIAFGLYKNNYQENQVTAHQDKIVSKYPKKVGAVQPRTNPIFTEPTRIAIYDVANIF